MEGIDGCAICWPQDPAAAWEARASLALVKELLDESHDRITVRACPVCSQHFLSIFQESVDWTDGDDPQYWQLMPLRLSETVALSIVPGSELAAALARLPHGRATLHRDAPKGAPVTVYWRGRSNDAT